jgi:hypothetical protein
MGNMVEIKIGRKRKRDGYDLRERGRGESAREKEMRGRVGEREGERSERE